MRCALIGSGSAGNALLVTAGDTRLLVDCGYSIKTFEARAAVLGFDPASLDAILVTHEHEDHLGGVLPLARKYALPVYWSRGTSLAASAKPGVRPVTHDAREPTQFVFRHGGVQVGVLTDLGSLTPHVLAAYAACNALILEFNHDPTLLAESAYPATLKARVASAYGHLSNAQSVGFLAQLDTSRLQRLVAAHLSERTNRPTLVAECLAQSVPGVVVEIARQDAVLPWFEV